MATENLHIEQRKVDTASFNTKTRVLTVPILDKEVPAYTYDLFMGHEVGHALWTPAEGWVDAQKDNVNKDILNVVEDSRIERKIKYKYPGIRNSFVKAYKDLNDQNFFGTEGVDIDRLNFIDRINLHQKVGAGLNIHFNDEEKVLLDAVESTDKFSEVIEVSKRIQEYLKSKVQEELTPPKPKKQKVKVLVKNEDTTEEKEEKPMEIPEGIDPDADTDFEFEYEDKPSDGESKEESEPSDNSGEDETVEEDIPEAPGGTSDSGEPEDEESEEEELESGQGGQETKFEKQLKEALEKEMRSFTNESYKEKEKELFDNGPGSFTYVDIPRFDTERCIFHYKNLYKIYKNDGGKTDLQEFNRIRTESNKVVSYLVKEFELRKNADEMKRVSISKTGELNMGKIFSYKFSEDIFKKVAVMPGGKSHGLVMFLDWSGSMHTHLENTIKQLISLVLFCKKVNVPYEVYAFSDGSFDEYTGKQIGMINGQMTLGKLSLLNFLSSKMSAQEFTYACSALVALANSHQPPHWLNLSSTPLNESIIAAMDIIPAFRKEHRLQLVNTVFLTDGDSNGTRYYYSTEQMYSSTTSLDLRKGSVVVFRDPITRNEVRVTMDGRNYGTGVTNSFIKLMKLRTNCNVVGFYVISGREFSSCAERWYKSEDLERAKADFKKERFAVLTNSGFDEYYFLRSNGLNTDEEEFEVEDGITSRGLVTAFTKYAGNKLANRVVLNRFIGMIA
jgi:hypothetical protein